MVHHARMADEDILPVPLADDELAHGVHGPDLSHHRAAATITIGRGGISIGSNNNLQPPTFKLGVFGFLDAILVEKPVPDTAARDEGPGHTAQWEGFVGFSIIGTAATKIEDSDSPRARIHDRR